MFSPLGWWSDFADSFPEIFAARQSKSRGVGIRELMVWARVRGRYLFIRLALN